MSDDQTPSVEEIKERLKIEEEDLPPKEESAATAELNDIANELANLGRQVAETLQNAWQSDERQKVEAQIKTGVESFASEIDKALNEVRQGGMGQKIRAEATQVKTKVESGNVGEKAGMGFAQGLRWLSAELGKIADKLAETDGEPTKEA